MSESAQQTPETAQQTKKILPDQPADREDPVNLGDPATWRKLDMELDELINPDVVKGDPDAQPEQPPQNAQDELVEKLDEAMADESAPSESDDESDEPADEARAEDDTEEFDIYAQTVPVDIGGDKRELTVGQLKDAAREYMHRAEEFKQLSAKADSIEQMHVGLYQQRAELQRIVAMMGQNIPAEAAQQLREHEQRFLQEQRSKVLEFKPEWGDPERFESDRKQVHAFAQQFGIHPTEINNIPDSRFIALLATAAEQAAMIKRSIEESKRAKPSPMKKARQARKEKESTETAFKRAAQMGNDDRKWAVLDNVLSGGR